MSRLILITGDLASGKSSLADSLSLRLNTPCFKKDLIKERLVDKYGFKTREENRELSIKAVEFMFDALNKFALNKEDIILEANFRKDELERILRRIAEILLDERKPAPVRRNHLENAVLELVENADKRAARIIYADGIRRLAEHFLQKRLRYAVFKAHRVYLVTVV